MPRRKRFPDSVINLDKSAPPRSGMIVNAASRADLAHPMVLHFSLAVPQDQSRALQDRVARGQVVPPAELAAYGADPQAASRLADWLSAQGFTIQQLSADHTSLYASADAATIARVLDVGMARVTRDGVTYTSASTAPSLPADVAADVQHIGGLQPFLRAHRHSRRRPVNLQPAPAAEGAGPNGYTIAQLMAAYGADQLPATGQGQEIAILIDTAPAPADLDRFWQLNAISPAPSVTILNVANTTLPAPEGEETLDVSWAGGTAPAAAIRVYAAGGLDFVALDRALDAIIADSATRPGLRQLSISLGLGEVYLQGPNGEVAAQHQKYLRLAAAGVNVFVSSGDAGSNPGPDGHTANGKLQAEYAASDPCVVAVGGTSLVLAADGAVAAESAWPGSGGGASRYFARPVWQKAAGIASGSKRLVPDVSLAADPNHGALLVLNGAPLPGGIGGTSWAAPVWAGFCARLNQARLDAGQQALGFLNPVLYALPPGAALRDITGGSNGAYTAEAGYDEVTGIGVPDIAALAQLLVQIARV